MLSGEEKIETTGAQKPQEAVKPRICARKCEKRRVARMLRARDYKGFGLRYERGTLVGFWLDSGDRFSVSGPLGDIKSISKPADANETRCRKKGKVAQKREKPKAQQWGESRLGSRYDRYEW